MIVQTFAQWKSYYPEGTTRKNTKKGLKNNIEKDLVKYFYENFPLQFW